MGDERDIEFVARVRFGSAQYGMRIFGLLVEIETAEIEILKFIPVEDANRLILACREVSEDNLDTYKGLLDQILPVVMAGQGVDEIIQGIGVA